MYNLTHSLVYKTVHIFLKGIYHKGNKIAWVELELAFYEDSLLVYVQM